MLLTQDENVSHYTIKKITLSEVDINHQIYSTSLIVMPHKLFLNWRPAKLQELVIEDFQDLFVEDLDVVLLGVGEFGGRLSPELSCVLFEKKLVVECMSLAAAARTYSILSAEGRNVAAALLFL